MTIVSAPTSWLRAAFVVIFAAAALPAHALVKVDLTSADSGTANGAVFTFTDQQPTGTGVIDPFLRVQNDPNEQGYNTSGGTPFDDKAGPWTHDIRLSDLQSSTVLLNGILYFKLLVDVNEPNGAKKSLISLDRLEFYTSPDGSKTTTDINSLGVLRWSLDGAGDTFVLLDASRNRGSGSGDMYAYIPATAFAGVAPTDFVYMFTRFGDQEAAEGTSAGGFEEWTIVKTANPVPEPSFAGLILIACGGMLALRRFVHRS